MSLTGKRVVVTGAGGSIGSEICRRVMAEGAEHLTMLGLTESALYNISKEVRTNETTKVKSVLGSVSDRALLREYLAGANVVIHAGAHKHVPICESNICECITNNVGGTFNLALTAIDYGVQQFVLISTDKAVRPSSIMGATKRVCERVVADFGGQTQFVVVRFGNVLDSFGSVLPLWREQIAKGGPLTLTDPDCERYFMAIPDAVELIFGALSFGEAGTYVFDMGEPKKMGALANELIVQEYATSGLHIDVKVTGLRQGEKLTEELHHGATLPTAHPKIFRVQDATEPVKVGDLALLLAYAREHYRDFARKKLMELAA